MNPSDQRDPLGQDRLDEKDFINESYPKDPGTIWLWLVIVMAVVLLMWGGREWFQNYLQEVKEERPFLDVTNRQVSLFLWQNPEYMRINASSKSAYLPGFQYAGNSVAIEPGAADQLVQAPPEVLFRYHTWSRLIRTEATPRAIPEAEFMQFLDYAEEWRPKNWANAPKGYQDLIPTLTVGGTNDLSKLQESVLPSEVRLAFIGWKNYTKEHDAIQALKVTYGQVQDLIATAPHYARNYWQNIIDSNNGDYVKGIEAASTKDVIPAKDVPEFLRIAVYNFEQAKRGL